MNKLLILFATTFVLLFSITGFGQRSLAGQEWTLVNLRRVDLGSADAYISFDATGRRFTGNTSCNIMNGNVRMRGNSISFGAIITTKRACIQSTAAVETGLLSALSRANRFQTLRNRLRLYSGKLLLAEFAPRLDPDKTGEHQNVADRYTLEDRKWVLAEINGVAIPKVEQAAFIVFDPVKGSAGGDTSCNVFGGNYTVAGKEISITETISTMRACIEDKRMDIERGFLDGLRAANRYQINADDLYLYRGDKLLLIFKGREK